MNPDSKVISSNDGDQVENQKENQEQMDNNKNKDSTDYHSDQKNTINSNTILTVQSIKDLEATSIISTNRLDTSNLSSYFYSEKITDTIYDRIYGNSYKKDCTINLDELRYVRVLYYGFDSKTHIGELIVNKKIADDICQILFELYEAKYSIERIELIDDYEADDEASMAANNSSSFNYRTISGTTKLSNHSMGLAIDINPLYNPYVKTVDDQLIISPMEASPYVDRTVGSPYLITENDICYKTFRKYGFTWGGDWKSCKDYQHFEKEVE